MASPPSHASPTLPTLSLPKKRPSLNTQVSNKRRKPSSAGPSGLRQTSFPPDVPFSAHSTTRRSQFSPDSQLSPIPHSGIGTRSPSVESSIRGGAGGATPSVISGSARGGKKRRRGGAAAAVDSGSAVGSASGRNEGATTGGAGSLVNGNGVGDDEGEDEEQDGDDVELQATLEGGKMSEAAMKQEREHLAMLIEAFTPDQADRYDTWRRVKLRKDHVRRLVNHTLSQSVPPAVITTVNGYTKVLLGELIERARDVQLEWQAAAATLPTNEPLADDAPLVDRMKMQHRGPLMPDHLREALRRYRKDRDGGSAGFLGLSLRGRETVAARAGGRRLFR